MEEDRELKLATESTSRPESVSKSTDMDTGVLHTEFAGARPKRPTEKGRLYTLNQKDKQITSLYRQLQAKMFVLNEMMAHSESSSAVQHCYGQWLSIYEEYLNIRASYIDLLGDEEDSHRDNDAGLLSFKSTVEEWTLASHNRTPSEIKPTDSASQAGSRHRKASAPHSHVSTASSLVSSRVREQQRTVEIEAKIMSLQKKRELETAKLNLKLEEEKFALNTELAISRAKAQVIDEQLSHKSSVLTKSHKLRATAPSFIPNKAHVHKLKTESPTRPQPMCDNVNTVNETPPVEYDIDNTQTVGVQQQTSAEQNLPVSYSGLTVQEKSSDNEIATVIRQLKKPVTELRTFNGEPLEYKRFIRQFTTKILVNTDNYEERLNYLEQYTGGEAHKIVTGYGYLEAQSGYEAAMKELDERYGNNEVLASAFVKRAMDWPAIKPDNTKALDEFGIFLAECSNAIQSIDAVKVLEYPDNLKKLVGKLPYFYHDKWRNKVQHYRDKGEQIKFPHLVDFVKSESKKANDPTYGRDALRDGPKPTTCKGKQKSLQKGTFATTETNTSEERSKPATSNTDPQSSKTAFTSPCMYCDKPNHSLEKCDTFQALPYSNRMDILKEKRLCFACLKYGHQSKHCQSKARCKNCKGRHPSICHDDNFQRLYPKTNQAKLTSASVNLDSEINSAVRAGDEQCTMAIIPVTVKMNNGLKSVQTYAFMDPGCSATFCTENLLRRIGGSGKPRKITLGTMGVPHKMTTFEVKGLQVGDVNMNNFLSLPKVYTKDKLPVSVGHIPTTEDLQRWPHMKDIQLPKIDADVELLIGNNIPDAYSPLDTRTAAGSGSPHATKTRLGWIAWNVIRPSTDRGQVPEHTVNRTHIIAVEEIDTLNQLDEQLRKSINLDYPEHVINDKKENSQEDNRFLQKVNGSMRLQNEHYTTDLPFRHDDIQFPDNRSIATQRLNGLKSKMAANAKFREDYKAFMSNLLDKGYAELVPPEEMCRSDGKVWFIPHHGVYHPRKPDKIRVVFDCAARYQGVSLNSELLQGPDLTNSLLAVLLRFRQEEIALMADIEAMFHQVHVTPRDRDCLRFLWWPNGNTDQQPSTYRMTVHLFGATSSPSCANAALRKTAKDNKDRFDENVSKVIERNFYVDDCVVSVQSEEQAINLIKNVTLMCQLGGFHLTKWTSNNRKVLQSISSDELPKELKTLDLGLDQLPIEHALGVYWMTEDDVIGFDVKLRDQPETKRGILSVVSSIYDPLGFASPYILTGRIILQQLCKDGVGWDDELPQHILTRWRQWITELPQLTNVRIPRCYKPFDFGNIVTCQLHAFSDASDSGYGVAIYVRLTNEHEQTHCALVMGKSRVTPLKKTTIPRMELTAATAAVRLCRKVMNELDYTVNSTHYWTDSMSVIRYVCNESTRFQTFVANRIAVIRDGSDPNQWHFVESKSNPADCASRGLGITKFLQNTEWLNGPAFLWTPEAEWPNVECSTQLQSDDPEVKATSASTVKTDHQQDTIDDLLQRHSSWLKLRTVMAWVLFAVEKFKCLLSNQVKSSHAVTQLKDTHLTVNLLRKAETTLIQHVQAEHFSQELQYLSQCPTGSRKFVKNSPLRKLDPILVDGTIRVGGRLSKADIQFDARHPVILPKSSRLTLLYLQYIHASVGHLGKSSMMAAARQKYWIPGATSIIKKLVSKCSTCRKYQARISEQKMGDLPADRLLSDQPPFSNVGMDYFGNFEVKRARSVVKRYGVIFTCLSTRAVHLEMATSLTTDSCINAIRRFISRRGPVNVIRSDNGTNLVGSQRELREEILKLNQQQIIKDLQQKNITWIFNPPTGSHHGGVWERLIRIVRKVLHSLLREQAGRLDDESLTTLFCEVEAILNGRPITEISSDCREPEALTPNHLLLMRGGESLPPGLFQPSDNYANRRWRQIQYLANIFWVRWRKEYLPLLQERQKWLHPRRNVQVNDLVLLVDNTPRNSWSLGRVLEIFADKKGLVRSVLVKTKTTTVVRPIDKLCVVLEAD